MINPQTAPTKTRDVSVGRSAWFDLPVCDLADAMSFYEALFGWQFRQMDNSAIHNYVMIDAHGELIGGLRRVESPHRRKSEAGGPVVYFTVENLAAAVARAKELGAELVSDTTDLGHERGGYQWIRDREGNLIGLWGKA